ncbi:hypothetical protein UA38_11840 [Photobacterium kishitanii]|uniref:DUF2384 domain-containing protein n=1 Tax=Photobacterium kishitanii TaxID=318456 RepID=A0AAX0YWN4_9GAMM|nr:hypothetical protein UA38_11840 [Photobacterium kishitanii]KJG60586.1 hypothetical protein UA42_14635 [Photobacterium kishitanii]KJG64887.1 hypothetical protein UA40_14325 [Photobacterium kishitanii]KJG68523.1 hypothetical protein UA41_16735 [Photobacterium kishitanii]PSX18322.1 hypothetical protein C0W70_15755 [Photobacterium kishitanii]
MLELKSNDMFIESLFQNKIGYPNMARTALCSLSPIFLQEWRGNGGTQTAIPVAYLKEATELLNNSVYI